MVTLTYIDAYHVERTTTYTDLAACILAFSGCVTLPDTYNVTSIHYKGKRLPYTGYWKNRRSLQLSKEG